MITISPMSYTVAARARQEAIRKARNAAFYARYIYTGKTQQAFRTACTEQVTLARALNRIMVARRREWHR